MTAEERENNLIASHGCQICRRLGYGITPANIHHVRRCGGKRKYAPKTGLCKIHHQDGPFAVHRGRITFEKHYNVTEWDLAEEAKQLLLAHGMTPTWEKK